MSALIQSVLLSVLSTLDQRGLLELEPGHTLPDLAGRILATTRDAKPHTQFSAWLSQALLADPAVAELYATNEQLVDVLRDVSA